MLDESLPRGAGVAVLKLPALELTTTVCAEETTAPNTTAEFPPIRSWTVMPLVFTLLLLHPPLLCVPWSAKAVQILPGGSLAPSAHVASPHFPEATVITPGCRQITAAEAPVASVETHHRQGRHDRRATHGRIVPANSAFQLGISFTPTESVNAVEERPQMGRSVSTRSPARQCDPGRVAARKQTRDLSDCS